MYAIYMESYEEDKSGYFASIKINKNSDYEANYSGTSPIKPRLTNDITKMKQWKTEKAAIKYANTLAERLRIAEYSPMMNMPRRFTMKYNIVVFNIATRTEVHRIWHYTRKLTH